MIYLSGIVHPEIGRLRRADLGVLITPHMGNRPEWLPFVDWAADNGMFSQPETFTIERYLGWLGTMERWRPRCLFATAPDVVGDAVATWELAEPTFELIRTAGYPVALVAQDGLEAMMQSLDWNRFDALFIGGSTKWKLSKWARMAAAEARKRGKHVHMGRVNSYRRLRLAKDWLCKSADGTFLRMAPDQNFPRMTRWLDRLKDQPNLFDFTEAAAKAEIEKLRAALEPFKRYADEFDRWDTSHPGMQPLRPGIYECRKAREALLTSKEGGE